MGEWWRKLNGGLRRDKIDAELAEEMRTHLEMKAEGGDERAARIQFGNVTLLLEESRAAWGWPQVEAWLRDLRYAGRVMFRRPAFACTVVLTLALGIGASSTIFSLIDTVLIRPLPYPDSARLVSISDAKTDDPRSRARVSPGRLEDYQRLTRTFEAVSGDYDDTLTDSTGAMPERLAGTFVSPGFFKVFTTPPLVGRVFNPDEEQFGGPAAIVISENLWRRRFSADPAILGRSLLLGGESYQIVGVMPRIFQYPSPDVEVWAAKRATAVLMKVREARFYRCVGRLKPGVTLEQAQADLAAVQHRLSQLYPKTDTGWTVVVGPLKDELVGKVRKALWLLLGTVTVLLLIACANVACLMLARLNSRTAEIATRCSLGAGRGAITRQLFAEGLIYSLAGGLLGLAAVLGGVEFLRKQLTGVPRVAELVVDWRILASVVAISILAAVLFSLAPILQTFRRDVTGSLIRTGRSLVGSNQRLPRTLVSAQFALATALLIGAGLFLKSLLMMQETPLGFRTGNVLTLRVSASFNERPEATIQRHRRIMEALSAVPGASAVSMSTGLPGVNPAWPREFEIAGEPSPNGTVRFATWRVVTDRYFDTVGLSILEGRTCRMSQDPKQPFEVLVNRSFAERYFDGRTAIGHILGQGILGDLSGHIVGVVSDAREDGQAADPQPLVYACGFLLYWPDSNYLIQSSSPAAMVQAAQKAIREVEPSKPIYAVLPLSGALHGALAQTRFRTLLVSLFSMMALVLAAVGLYGVMAYMVSQRTREIGIRVALGARTGQIVGEILRSGGTLAGLGAAAGIVLAAMISKTLASMLYGVRPSDLSTYSSAVSVLLGVALLACLIPSRRAALIDPTEALREQ
jgi:predicted permease